MLGWEIIVKNQEVTLASWRASAWGTDWLENLVKEGKAQNLATNSGYPQIFSMKAKDLLPILIAGIPQTDAGLVIGEDYAISGTKVWNFKINQIAMNQCKSEDELLIEAWDQS